MKLTLTLVLLLALVVLHAFGGDTPSLTLATGKLALALVFGGMLLAVVKDWLEDFMDAPRLMHKQELS